MTARIEKIVTSGTFSLDGQDFAVDNNGVLMTLPPETIVHTGHGDDTTIGDEAHHFAS